MPLAIAGRTLIALLALTALQLRPPGRTASQGRPATIAEAYGEPRDVELASIAYATESTRREHVRTRGRFEMLATSNTLFAISEGGNRVLVVLGHGLDGNEIRTLLGARVSVRGIVRPIRPKEYIQGVDVDLIEDPLLPVLPAPDASLPRVSLTLLSISDDEEPGRPPSRAVAGLIGQILANPESFTKAVSVVGQFRGSNLFDDLPKESQQDKDDWVLRDGAHAAWIVGRPPRGKGFSLSLDSKNDSARRLEVTGKATVVNGIVYIKASRVEIAARTAKPPAR